MTSTTDNPTFTAACKRTPDGAFAPGNPGGPGNPHVRKVAFLRKSLNECISASQVKMVVDAMFKLALVGNVQAAKLFLQYAVGKPQEAFNPDRVEIDEWQLRQDSIVSDTEFTAHMKHTPLPISNSLVSVQECLTTQKLQREWVSALEAIDPRRHPQPARPEAAETPVAQAADLPKAPEVVAARTSPPVTNDHRQQTAETAPSHRQQTAETAHAHRQQTAETAHAHRQQTGETAHAHRQQTVVSAGAKSPPIVPPTTSGSESASAVHIA